jgi:hypothetical protein
VRTFPDVQTSGVMVVVLEVHTDADHGIVALPVGGRCVVSVRVVLVIAASNGADRNVAIAEVRRLRSEDRRDERYDARMGDEVAYPFLRKDIARSNIAAEYLLSPVAVVRGTAPGTRT